MPYYDSIGEMIAAANIKATNILNRDVSKIVKQILIKHINDDIYISGHPLQNAWVNGTTYQRRHVLQGSIISELKDNNTLFVTSTANASPPIVRGSSFSNGEKGAFLHLLESGNLGFLKRSTRGANPGRRPAVSNAQREVESSGDVTAAIQRGINREFGQ